MKSPKRLSIDNDFTLYDKKIGDYYISVRNFFTNLLRSKKLIAKKSPLNRTSIDSFPYISFYIFR